MGRGDPGPIQRRGSSRRLLRQLERSDQRPETDFDQASEQERYARKANRVAIHHGEGNVVAVIEIVSPGNKDSSAAIRTFAEKVADLLRQGVNMLIVDLFPPGPRDPQGIHKVISNEIGDQPFALPPGKPLTLAAYQAEPTKTAYVEPVAVGNRLPEMPPVPDRRVVRQRAARGDVSDDVERLAGRASPIGRSGRLRLGPRASTRPVLGDHPRHATEITPIAGDDDRAVFQGDGRDTQVHRSDIQA